MVILIAFGKFFLQLPGAFFQFRERGRLPFYEEETFARDSWLTVLLGQGVIPRRIDSIVSPVSLQQSKQAIVQIENEVSRLVQQLPKYPDYLRNFYRQAAR